MSRVADAPEPFDTLSAPPSWNVPELVVMYKNVLSLATKVTVPCALDTEPVTVLPTANVPVIEEVAIHLFAEQ